MNSNIREEIEGASVKDDGSGSKLKVQRMRGPPGKMPSSQQALDDIFDSAQNWLKKGSSLDGLYECDVNNGHDHNTTVLGKRTMVISKVLDYLESIQKESLRISANRNDGNDPVDLLSISLHDMKIFNALTNILVIEGIYPCLPIGVGIPLELRFKGKRRDVANKEEIKCTRSLLNMIMTRLEVLITTKGDVRDIILLGTYSSDLICGCIELAFDPEHLNENDNSRYQSLFRSIIDQIDTFTLFTCYLSLLRPGTPSWFRAVISHNLALIPIIRQDGIRSLLEFIGGLREKDQISIDDLDKAVRILRSLPKDVELEDYQQALADQFITILSNPAISTSANNLVVAAIHVIYSLYEQRPILLSRFQKTLIERFVPIKEVDGVFTSENDLNNCIDVISSLIKDPSQPTLLLNIRDKIVVSLWLLLTFLYKSKRPTEVTVAIIVSLLNIEPSDPRSSQDADKIVRSLLIDSQGPNENIQWTYGAAPNGGVEIKRTNISLPRTDNLEIMEKTFQRLDERIDLFIKLMGESLDAKIISGLFIIIVRRWLSLRGINEKEENKENELSDPFSALVDVKLIQKLVEEQKDYLMKSPTEIIELISSMITEYVVTLEDGLDRKRRSGEKKQPTLRNLSNIAIARNDAIPLPHDSDDEEEDEENELNDDSDDENEVEEQGEVITLCLSLITGLILEEVNDKDLELLRLIIPQLQWLLENGPSNLRSKIERAIEVLRAPRSAFPGEDESELNDSTAIYNKAIVSLDDPIIPIRAHGLHLLRTLIQKKDPIIAVESALKIFIGQLKAEDSFIYLNSIKGLEDLNDVYGYQSVLPVILGHYSDIKVSIDERLRTGEVILRIVQRLDELLTGDAVEMIAETLLSIVSMRSSSDSKNVTDDRLRMSAMSILGTACELNPLGFGKYLLDIVDCAVGILTFEVGDEMAIMRRSAVVLIGSLLKGINSLEGVPKKEIETVLIRIRYAKETDSDALVRIQAGNVLDILEDKLRS